MHSKLAEILKVKKTEVAELKKRGLPPPPLDMEEWKKRDFKGAISVGTGINLIAEIKFASPSAGMIRERMDPLIIGKTYQRAGAAAISFLTDRAFFKGDIEQMPRLKRAVSLPLLRKDFIIDEIQVEESELFGADAVLLISRILSKETLRALIVACRERGLAALTEVHDRQDLEKAVDCGAEIIGINNRDLDTFKIDIQTTFQLAPLVPEGCTPVCESGIGHGRDIDRLKGTGIRAALVGSALMGSGDLEKTTREMVAAGEGEC